MKYDYHIHSEDSYDSVIKAEELIVKAIKLNYKQIAFTEHLDLLPQELSVFGLPSLTRYRARITALQQRYPQLKILCGIEIGDYHLVRDFAAKLIQELNFDIILGAVHFLSDHRNIAVPMAKPLSEEAVMDYYRQNLALVSTCDIHVLAHLGVYKRYYPAVPNESYALPLLIEIFKVMIERKIALEINYSALRKNYPGYLPEPPLVELYQKLGGKLFSIGSDSHAMEHFDDFHAMVPPYPSFLT